MLYNSVAIELDQLALWQGPNRQHPMNNETNKLSHNFTGKAIIKNHYSDSKTTYTIKIIYTLKNGLINGEQKTYFNDTLLQKVSFTNDVANGSETIYWSNGIPAITGSWKNNYMTGKWIAYYVTGGKGLEWHMDNGVISGKIQAWDISGNELASSNNKNGKFIHLYGAPIDYIYRVASPLHMIENKQKFTVSDYKNGRKLSSSKVMFETTQKELNLLKMYIKNNKANEYASYMSIVIPKLGNQ